MFNPNFIRQLKYSFYETKLENKRLETRHLKWDDY